ncbi:MAG: hypothetical protein QXO51_07400 [Halobacteria archaeon]
MDPPSLGLVYLHLFRKGDRIGARPGFLSPRDPVQSAPSAEQTLTLLQGHVIAAARSPKPPGPVFPKPGERFVLVDFEECRDQPSEVAETLSSGKHLFMTLGWFPSPAEAALAVSRAREFLESFAGPAAEP